MSQPGLGNGEAFDATVRTEEADQATAVPFAEHRRTEAQQEYLDNVADAAETALEDVEQTIKHLQESLPDRRAQAEQARAEADQGRAE